MPKQKEKVEKPSGGVIALRINTNLTVDEITKLREHLNIEVKLREIIDFHKAGYSVEQIIKKLK